MLEFQAHLVLLSQTRLCAALLNKTTTWESSSNKNANSFITGTWHCIVLGSIVKLFISIGQIRAYEGGRAFFCRVTLFFIESVV